MAINGQETDAFQQSLTLALLGSGNYARTSGFIIPAPPIPATTAFAMQIQRSVTNDGLADALSLYSYADGVYPSVYQLTQGTVVDYEGAYAYRIICPVLGTFQNYTLCKPGLYHFVFSYKAAQDSNGVASVPFTVEYGICGIPGLINPGVNIAAQGQLFPCPPSTLSAKSVAIGTQATTYPVNAINVAGNFDSRIIFGANATWAPYFAIKACGSILNPRTTGQFVTWSGYQIPGPAITQQPQDAAVVHPASAQFSVTTLGTATYQWQVSANGGASFANITTAGTQNYSGFKTATLTIGTTSVGMNGWLYRCNCTDSAGTIVSGTGQLTVT